MNRCEVFELKKKYKKGTRVVLHSMSDDPNPIPKGTKGTVEFVDDIGGIFVNWDNGRKLSLIVGIDSFSIISP